MENIGTPVIANVAVTNGGAWESYQIPVNTIHFSVKCRTAVDLKVGMSDGASAYITIPSGSVWNSPFASWNKPTLYFDAASSVTVEIISYPRP